MFSSYRGKSMSFKCYKFGVLFYYVSDFLSWKWTVFLLLSTMEHSSCNLWRCCPERRQFQSFSGKFGSVTGTCSLTGTLIETNNMNHSIFIHHHCGFVFFIIKKNNKRPNFVSLSRFCSKIAEYKCFFFVICSLIGFWEYHLFGYYIYNCVV